MRQRTVVPVLLVIVMCLTTQPALAVIIFLKGQDQPIRGYLVREDEKVVVIDQLLPDDTTKERVFSRISIDDIIRTVSTLRLEALQPDNPDKYREYAEELAEKSEDPDAQVTAIRLFLIAAHLAPDRLGRSCLLGMVPLARNDTEQRRFRAMAYLLDPTHDPKLLTMPVLTTSPKSAPDPSQADYVLRTLRLLRQGKQHEAMAQGRRSKIEERLPLLTNTITYAEFELACQLVCPHCERGHQKCTQCKGRKVMLGKSCATCGARGVVTCPVCGGEFRDNKLSPSLLKRIVQLELSTLPLGRETVPSPLPHRIWSQSAQQDHVAPFSPLTLETLTQFDPRLNKFCDGRWTL